MAKTKATETKTNTTVAKTAVAAAAKAVAAKKEDVKTAVTAKKEEVKKETPKAVEKKTTKPVEKKPAKTATKPAAKKPGRKPAKKPVEKIQEIFIEYDNEQFQTEKIVEQIHEVYKAEGHRVGAIKSLRVYIDPIVRKAYYVINDKAEGKFVEF
ncbi:MAG: DUF6465 family protein [Eubacteriales bacterium]|nr:DUF6465 family protein [Eubacteriales bacterium]